MSRNVYFTMLPAGRTRTPREEIIVQEEYWACIAIPVLFWLFASLTLTMGFYGTKSVVLGPNYSHLFEANSLLVNQIEVSNKQQAGPVLYSFSVRPVLGSRTLWNESHKLVLDPDYHQEFGMWLNRGSKLSITCFIRSSGFFSILLTVSEGYRGLQEWIQDPTNPQMASAWKDVHGQVGQLEYEAPRDGDYYIAVGNLNQQSVAIELQFEVNATMYSTDSADHECSLGNGKCQVQLSITGNRYALLTTPLELENGTRNWEVKISYGVRWVTYFIVLACVLSVVSATLKILSGLNCNPLEEEEEEEEEDDDLDSPRAPLLTSKETTAESGSSSDSLTADDRDAVNLRSEDTNDAQLCAVCLDAPKNVFFIPCGHCATCLPCGRRIRQGEAGTCPICRVKIEKIKRVFHV